MENPQCQANHLHVLGSGGGADVSGPGPDIVDDALLQPWDQEVGAFVHDLVLDTGHTVEDDGAGAAFDIVYGGVGEREADGGRHSPLVDGSEGVGGHVGIMHCDLACSCVVDKLSGGARELC